MEDSKVSIITPLYNSRKFIKETINSVIGQTYSNWELIVIDDCSSDGSNLIVEEFIKKDDRIKYFKTESPSGSPTLPRNIGIELSSGRYIAFLDSDDVWSPEKLRLQIDLFCNKVVGIVFSNYEKIDEEGRSKNRVVIAPNQVSYNDLLKGNVIACSTAVYDVMKIGKLYFLNQGHEDYVMWLSILKKEFIGQNSGDVLAKYRVRKSSISSNKIKAVQWVWRIYRENEKLSILKSMYYLVITLAKSFIKYFK